MEFLFTDFSPDIERTIVQNVQYRNNMNSVIRQISRVEEAIENELGPHYRQEGLPIPHCERFGMLIEILDIEWNLFTNEAIFECDSEYYNIQ